MTEKGSKAHTAILEFVEATCTVPRTLFVSSKGMDQESALSDAKSMADKTLAHGFVFVEGEGERATVADINRESY